MGMNIRKSSSAAGTENQTGELPRVYAPPSSKSRQITAGYIYPVPIPDWICTSGHDRAALSFTVQLIPESSYGKKATPRIRLSRVDRVPLDRKSTRLNSSHANI